MFGEPSPTGSIEVPTIAAALASAHVIFSYRSVGQRLFSAKFSATLLMIVEKCCICSKFKHSGD